MQRNPVNSIDINNDLKISCEITAENYQNIIISYNSASKNKPLSINDYEITTPELAKNKNWKTYKSKVLDNLLEAYFNGTLSAESDVCECCVCLDPTTESGIFLPGVAILDSNCAKNLSRDPVISSEIYHIIEIKLIPYLIEQKNKPEPGYDNLHLAISNNDNNSLAQYLFQKKYDLDQKNSKGKTPLQLAFEMNNAVAIRLLLISCATPDYMAFMNAVDSGKWDLVFSFIDNNAYFNLNNNCIDIYTNVLLKAAHANQIKIVQLLLEKNIKPTSVYNSNDANFGYGAIHFAVWHKDNHHEMLKLLLQYGADPNMQYSDISIKNVSRSPLVLALEANDAEAVEILFKNGAKPTYTALANTIKNNCIDAACAFITCNPAAQGEKEAAKNSTLESIYKNIFSDSLQHKRNEIIQALIICGYPINWPMANSKTPLEFAMETNNDIVVNLLMSNENINIDYKPLKKAIENKNFNAAISFIQSNPEKNTFIEYSKIDALFLASKYGCQELVEELRKAKCNSIHYAIMNNDNERIKELIKLGVNVDEKSINGETPLQLALIQNNAEVVALLLQNKAKPDVKALSKAADEKKWAAVNSYIQNTKSDYDILKIYEIILCKAAADNKFETVKLLIEQNIHTDLLFNNTITTPLEHSLKNNNPEITALLLNNKNKKASPNALAFSKAVNANCWKSATAYLENNSSSHDYKTKEYYEKAIVKAVNVNEDMAVDAESFIIAYINAKLLSVKFCIENPGSKLLEKLCLYTNLNLNEFVACNTSPLQFALQENNADAIAFILQQGIKVDYDMFKSQIDKSYHHPLISSIIAFVENNKHEHAGVMYGKIDALYLASKNYSSKKESWEKLKSAFINAGCCALHVAIENNKSDEIENLIKQGMNVNERNEHGLTPAALAFKTNNAKAVGLLIKNRAARDYKLFEKAVAGNQWDLVFEFVTNNPDETSYECVNAYPTALLNAAKENKLEVVTALLNRHAGMHESIYDFNNKENNGWYAIHFAVHHKNHTMLRLLLANKAKTDVNRNLQPLQLAMQNDDSVATELLLNHGAEADYTFFKEAVHNKCWKAAAAFVKSCKVSKPHTLLSQAFTNAIDLAVKQNQDEFIKAYIEAGLLTIEFAIQYPQTILLEQWLKHNPNTKNASAIQFAANNNKPEAVALLLQNGFAPDYNALQLVIKNKQWDIAITFVKNNKDVNAGKNYGFLPNLHFASVSNELKTLLLCAGCSKLYSAVQQKNNVELKKLLENNYNPNEKDFTNYQTPLELAFQTDNAEAITLLLQHAALCNYDDFKKALLNGKWNLVIEFVKNNKFYSTRPEAFKDIYDRAMTVAGNDNQTELIQCLLETKAISLSTINSTFKTVLLNNNVKATALLLSQNANVDEAILLKAIEFDCWDAATLLITHQNISRKCIYSIIITAHDNNHHPEFIDACIDAGLFTLKDAIRSGRIELLKRYHAKKEIDFNAELEKNKTLLQYAFEVNNDSPAIFAYLLESGVKPDYNAFILAIDSRYSNSTCAFVKTNSEKKALVEYSNFNALYLAKKAKLEDLVTVMIESGCNAIHDAVLDNNIKALENLLENQINPDQGDVAGRTPLQVAIESGKTEVISFLLQYKIDQNSKLGNVLINYALNYAIETNSSKAFEYLLKTYKISSDDINFLLEHAFEMPAPNMDIIILLLDQGADLNFDILINALKKTNGSAVLTFIYVNTKTLADPECNKAYSEGLNMIFNAKKPPSQIFNALLPVLFLQLTSECRKFIKNETKGQLVNLYINKFSNEKFAFNNDDHIRDMLKKIICIFMQREEFQLFSSTSSSDQLCKILLKPEYKYFLNLICGDENKLELTYDDLLAFVRNKNIKDLNSDDTAIFTYQNKDEKYESYKPGSFK